MPRPKKDRAISREVGRRIRAIREDLGMGQIDFLDYVEEKTKVRYAQSKLSGIENGDKIVTADDVIVFGQLFPGGTDELLHGRRTDARSVQNSVVHAPQSHAPRRAEVGGAEVRPRKPQPPPRKRGSAGG
jgi:transcriptional regulator with XRE-family HTH domain